MAPKIINMHKVGNLVTSKSDNVSFVLVDRGTDWGNPFIMHTEEERDAVCDQFELYALWRLTIEPHWLDPLIGHNLGCWCAPKRCHAETLMRLANAQATPAPGARS